MSLWQGHVTLHGLEIKPEAFDALGLPVVVHRGYIGTLKITIPWKALTQQSLVIDVDSVFVVLKARRDVEWDEQYERKLRYERNQSALQRFEAERGKEGEVPAEAQSNGYIARLQQIIIANMKTHLHNVHVRYEDTDQRLPFALGATFRSLSSIPSNADWVPVFVTELHSVLRRVVELRQCALYLAPGASTVSADDPPAAGGTTWQEQMMEALFSKAEDEYLMAPVDCEFRGLFQHGDALDLQHARADGELRVHSSHLRLNEVQYECLIRLAQYLSNSERYERFRRFRPAETGAGRLRAAHRWRFAIACVRFMGEQDRRALGPTWADLRQHISHARQYIALYERKACPELHQPLSRAEEGEVRGLETDMAPTALVACRQWVYATVADARKRRVQAALAERQAARHAGPAAGGGWFSWLGWVPTGMGVAVVPDPPPPPPPLHV